MRRAGLILLALASCSSGTGSLGAMLGRDNDTRAVTVRTTPKGLAADKAGLLPGDQILMIDGIYVRDLDEKALREKLRGDVGTKVELTVARGREIFHVVVVRSALREPPKAPPKETKER